jgi:hypothetical protein
MRFAVFQRRQIAVAKCHVVLINIDPRDSFHREIKKNKKNKEKLLTPASFH